jgi:hypothetical protein
VILKDGELCVALHFASGFNTGLLGVCLWAGVDPKRKLEANAPR